MVMLTEKLQRVMCPGPRSGAPVQLAVYVVGLDVPPHNMVKAVQVPTSLVGSCQTSENNESVLFRMCIEICAGVNREACFGISNF